MRNHSITTGIFPNAWKRARVLPIFKEDPGTDANNYRPTVPLKCKLPPSRETRLISLETSLVSLEKFLVSLECTASTNALPLGECTNGIIEK